MQFGIRDLLILTFVAAMVALVFLGREKVTRLQGQVVELETMTRNQQTTIDAKQGKLVDAGPRADYAKQIQLVNESAVASFATVRKRYSQIEPQPGKVVVRSIPEFDLEAGMSADHFRLSIPLEFPVFLRSGIQQKVNWRDQGNLDQVNWLSDAPFADSSYYETPIEPGVHDLWIVADNKGSNIEIRLGEENLIKTKFIDKPAGRVSSGPAGKQPFSFSLTKSTRYLRKIEFGDRTSGRYEFWIWFSSESDVAGCQRYSERSKSRGDSTNE